VTTLLARLRRFVVALACLVPATGRAQDDFRPFSKRQIDQLTAQVALFPDALLSQVLMAATYPADVAEARSGHAPTRNENGDAAVALVDDKPWDPSVQSLVAFPRSSSLMGENPTWVKDLGDAFLLQPEDVMDSVQRLPHCAQRAGNLASNEHVNVTVELRPPADFRAGGGGAATATAGHRDRAAQSAASSSCRCTTRCTCSGRGCAAFPPVFIRRRRDSGGTARFRSVSVGAWASV